MSNLWNQAKKTQYLEEVHNFKQTLFTTYFLELELFQANGPTTPNSRSQKKLQDKPKGKRKENNVDPMREN